jgi:hypothetical protein
MPAQPGWAGHPNVARYVGTGSIDDAASFVCKMP